jgi:hypothetical protein
MAVGIAGFLLGLAIARLVQSFSPSSVEKTAEQRNAENRALKQSLAQLAQERIPALEAELTRLQMPPKSAQPAVDAAKVPPAPAKDGAEPEAADPARMATRGRTQNAAVVATALGLDPVRRKQFEESYERVLSKLQETEKLHASVSRQGNEVAIHIPPFADEGTVLRQEWSSVLLTTLSPDEQDRYNTLKLDRALFPREIGVWDRSMVYQPEENAVWPKLENGNRYWPNFYERWTKPGEQEVDPSTRWIWSGPEAVRCYRHLLDPKDCRFRQEDR